MTHGTDGIDSTYGTFGNGGAVRPGSEPHYNLKMFGEIVKTFRKRARLTQEQFAPLVGYSLQTIASIEQGRRLPPRDFVERADERSRRVRRAAGGSKASGAAAGAGGWFRQWARLEAAAISLYTYECRVIPGLLQTEAYARALFTDQLPPLDDEQIEAQLAARLERQELLRDRPNTAFSFILEEHLFLRQYGRRGGHAGAHRPHPRSRPSCATSRSRSCRWYGSTTRAGRPHAAAGDPGEPVVRLLGGAGAAASSSPTRKRSACSRCGMPVCAHRLSSSDDSVSLLQRMRGAL